MTKGRPTNGQPKRARPAGGGGADPYHRFLRLSRADCDRLAELGRRLAPELPAVVAEFYDHLGRFPELQRLLQPPGVMERLREILLHYLGELLGGRYGAAYEESRRRVGERHLEVGLEPRWYLASFNLVVQLLLPRIATHLEGDPAGLLATTLALSRVVTLDQTIAMERYVELYTRELDAAHQRLKEHADDLEERVETRTRELIHSGRFALIGELASGLAHEIGTPLNIISGTADWLLADLPEESPHRPELTTIGLQTQRITDLVWQLLHFARPEEAEVVPTPLADVLTQVRSLLHHRLENHAVVLGLDLPADLPPVRAVPEQLQQVFLNLLVNADHALEGRPVKRIRVVARAEGERVVVEISDTGCGIPATHLDRLFDPFFTTKPPGKGTGLGLSITRRILASHGGEIEIHSAPEQGATVIVHLPVWRAAADAAR
ncbi:MAG: hypothetical protein COW73_04550 [Nitrospirae bacterium CG18_big_fil_WC_8_21_14_2_50_70_55]|nr:hypothetical protein [Deltaproteobacteria bacterium]OIP62944.1 MAG: hypothetical protein AUK30_09285 [Nitrospirae bacterium CG2_30_70_394]PIQ05851.1 MAG: hypothetical protein COW73_04550 [Nitrospirae bacterium CG18_big_fil_WC_8_21_14_2_50_70_55]PIU77466.1 MAG: hypothetical protein COS73_10440 [Nitrospirae bacterium CG06_land_8_20_14_3_00_70_43]PIW82911.1 MAG: hypothetical protein COZ96_06260 [Nitrospirae bacterium CG_4_8_14_3_um_filter_70_85]PIX83489.1 MAG: hypothetical protein COZ33_05200 